VVNETDKRRRLAAGETSLDLYDMRACFEQGRTGLVYVDTPEDVWENGSVPKPTAKKVRPS